MRLELHRFELRKASALTLDGFALATLTQSLLGTWTWPLGAVLHFAEVGRCVLLVGLDVAVVRRSKWRIALHGVLLSA